MNDNIHQTAINRWKLILGSLSGNDLQFGGNQQQINQLTDMEELLDYLYSRAQGDDVRQDSGRSGGLGKIQVMAAEWITKIRKLFPRETADVLENHALEKFNMTELLADKEILERMTPDMNLLKTILQLKHLMHGNVLDTARKIAAKVAQELSAKIENDIRRTISGRVDRTSSSPVKSARILDFKRTIRRNLQNYDSDSEQLILKNIYFSNRVTPQGVIMLPTHRTIN